MQNMFGKGTKLCFQVAEIRMLQKKITIKIANDED